MKKILAFLLLTVVGIIGFSSVVFAKDQDDRGPLTKIIFIHYKKDKSPAKSGGGAKPGSTACYGYLAKGAKWRTPEPYLINPDYSGLTENAVLQDIHAGVAAWEASAGAEIFASGSPDYTVAYNNGDYVGYNTASFGDYPDNSVIAITSVWGYFSGPPQSRELLEWHMLFNTRFPWGDANPSAMDLQNIATHELGHSAGMGDLYTSSCTEETMYGYSSLGETKKQTLEAGDIAGISALYK